MSDFDFENFLPYQLSVTANAVSESFARIYRQSHGISRAEWRILFHLGKLNENEFLSVRDLVTMAHLEKSKASRAVTRLVKHRLVFKKMQADDQRLVDIGLTEFGREMVRELTPIAQDFNAQLVKRLTPEEQDAFLSAIRKLMQSV